MMIRYGDTQKPAVTVEQDNVVHTAMPTSCPKCGSHNLAIGADGRTMTCLGCKAWSSAVAPAKRHG